MSNLINGKQIKSNTINIGGVNNKLVSTGNFSMGTNGIQSSYVPTTNIDLINKLYLDNVINNITTESTTAGNGLTILGKTVKLGGTLTENTVVGGSSGTYSVAFGDGVSANNLNNFDVFTKVGGYINLQGGNASYIFLNGNDDIDISSTTLDISVLNAVDISGGSIILGAGTAGVSVSSNAFKSVLKTTNLTANRAIEFPNQSGTLALISDLAPLDTYGSNGITKTGLTFELGGTLNKNTTIDSNTFNLNFSGTNGIKYSADYSASYTDRTLVDKGYLDSTIAGAIEGLNVKQAVRVASTSGLTLSGLQTIDGVTVIVGDRVLVKNQTLGEQNGIYIASSSGWVRSVDFDALPSDSEILNAFFFVSEGTTNADTGWVLTNNPPIIINTTPLVFAQFSSAGVIQAGTGLTKVGNNLNVNVGNGVEIVGNNISVNLHSSSGLTFDSTDLTINAAHSATVATNGSFVKIADNTNKLFIDFNDYQSNVVVSEVTSNNVTGSIGNSGASLSLSSVKLVGEPRFFVNGIMYKLGFNGTASNNLVFVSPNGSTVRTTLASIINGDNIYWNPLFANAFDLDTTDRLQLVYDTQNL